MMNILSVGSLSRLIRIKSLSWNDLLTTNLDDEAKEKLTRVVDRNKYQEYPTYDFRLSDGAFTSMQRILCPYLEIEIVEGKPSASSDLLNTLELSEKEIDLMRNNDIFKLFKFGRNPILQKSEYGWERLLQIYNNLLQDPNKPQSSVIDLTKGFAGYFDPNNAYSSTYFLSKLNDDQNERVLRIMAGKPTPEEREFYFRRKRDKNLSKDSLLLRGLM